MRMFLWQFRCKENLKGTQFRVETRCANKEWQNLIALAIGGCVWKKLFRDVSRYTFSLFMNCDELKVLRHNVDFQNVNITFT
jgi:hypothetical protein